jgi:Secretion system C-terminal sorting domain
MRCYSSMKYATLEDFPNVDMIDNFATVVNCVGTPMQTFTPKFFNTRLDGTFPAVGVRKAYYPNGTAIPATIASNGTISFNVDFNSSNGFVNGGGNFIIYETSDGGCTHTMRSMDFSLQNVIGPTAPPTPIFTYVNNSSSTLTVCSNAINLKTKILNPTSTISVSLDGLSIPYNAIDSSITYNAGVVGTHTISITYTNNVGSATNDTIFTTITSPNITVASTPASATVCIGQSVILNTTGASTYTYSPSATNNVAFIPSATNTYTVTATGANGCTTTAIKLVTVNALPTLTITATPTNATICAGQNITLSTTGASTYTYSPSATNNIAFAPSTSSTYTITATNANGCISTTTKLVVVNAPPTLTLTASPSSAIVCAGQSITLSSVGASTYTYNPGATNNLAFAPSTSNTYTVTATAANGCTNTATKLVVVNALPAISITGNPSTALICLGQNATLTASGASTYSWTGGITNGLAFAPSATTIYTVTATNANGCSTSATKQITVSSNTTSIINQSICAGENYQGYTVAGTYIDTFASAAGCDSVRTLNLTVNALPTILLTAMPTNVTVCAGASVTLSATGASTYTFNPSAINNVAFVPTSTSTYTITATGTNGCTTTTTKLVVVNALPILNITAIPNDSVCVGDTVTLTASGASTYSWTGSITNAVAFVINANAIYTVTAIDINTCSTTTTQSLTALANTVPTLQISANKTAGATGEAIVYTAITNVPMPYTINWYVNNILQTSASSATWATTIVAGTNTVQALIFAPSQCLNPDSASSNQLEINNITALSNSVFVGIHIYPNPATDFIAIDGILPSDEIIIRNTIGQILLKQTGSAIVHNGGLINVASFASGIYMVQLDRNGVLGVLKLVK